jgi:5-methyltetrahydrofolate--homocysteine methyltransferase
MADLESLKKMIIDGNEGAGVQTEALLAEGHGAREILDSALLPGMEEVGRRMKSGELFIPEVLLSATIMQACLEIVRPHLAAGESATLATVVIGTVEGDMHDIGKNLVAMLLAGAGFNVINLGKGITPAQFVAAVKEHKPAILGMSGLLTTTIPKMPATIKALQEAGLRDTVKVIVGGAPVSEEYAKEVGADEYGPNASIAVDRCKALIGVASRS